MPISEYLRKLRAKIGNDCIMMPAVSAIVVNARGEVLLHQSRDDGRWYVIGGAPEPGEPPARAAVRETLEETGVLVRVERLVGVFNDPLIRYPNGDQVLYTAVTFLCRPIRGEPKVADDESLQVRYFAPDALPDSLLGSHRHKIERALAQEAGAYFEWDEAWLSEMKHG